MGRRKQVGSGDEKRALVTPMDIRLAQLRKIDKENQEYAKKCGPVTVRKIGE